MKTKIEKLYSIDEQEPTTLWAIIKENDLSYNDIETLSRLKVGQGMFIGLTDIKRVQ